jgi:hypothetical protein
VEELEDAIVLLAEAAASWVHLDISKPVALQGQLLGSP